jgi:ferrochelatase
MRAAGVRRALAYVTSLFASYSGCRQYLEAIEWARAEVGEGAPDVHKLRSFYNHPDHVAVVTERVRAALEALPEGRRGAARVVFTAHSIPVAMASGCDYAAQFRETAGLVAGELGLPAWDTAYQSRSGAPQVPWLGPDILDQLADLREAGIRDVVAVPVGFLSDHMEVVYDLDVQAAERAAELGLGFVRAGTAGNHPRIVATIRELVEERLGRRSERRWVGTRGVPWDVCSPDCCRPPLRP